MADKMAGSFNNSTQATVMSTDHNVDSTMVGGAVVVVVAGLETVAIAMVDTLVEIGS